MYPVVVSDLDGTLLNSDHQLSKRTCEVIQQLSQKGIRFIFATGRPYHDVERIRSQLGIDMFLITSNGARVHNRVGEQIIEHDMPPALARSVMDLRKEYPDTVHANVYRGENWYVEVGLPELSEFHKDSGFMFDVVDFEHFDTHNVQKVFFVANAHDDLLPIAQKVQAQFGDQLSTAFSLPTCFEVMAAGVNKGRALEEVLKVKGFELKDAIAFGDGMNDFEMLGRVGKGLVMANAADMLKNRLPHLEQIGNHDDDAVANYLANLYGI